jgi:predicted RNase H-like HicB family nuclease
MLLIWTQKLTGRGEPMRRIKIVVEKHPDGYVAYSLGLKGVVVGEGDTYEGALADVESAIRFYIETFGNDVFKRAPNILGCSLFTDAHWLC